jgi:hypothetical protein
VSDNAKNAGEPTTGDSIENIENVSGGVPTIGATVRPAQSRDSFGRWRPRSMTLVRGLTQPGSERTELLTDSVTGKPIRGRNDAVLLRDPMNFERVHYTSPDYSYFVPDERKSHAAVQAAQADVNHVLSCPTCATGGACNV